MTPPKPLGSTFPQDFYRLLENNILKFQDFSRSFPIVWTPAHHASFVVSHHGVVAARHPPQLRHLERHVQAVGESVVAWTRGEGKQKHKHPWLKAPGVWPQWLLRRAVSVHGGLQIIIVLVFTGSVPRDVSMTTSTFRKIPRRSSFCRASWDLLITWTTSRNMLILGTSAQSHQAAQLQPRCSHRSGSSPGKPPRSRRSTGPLSFSRGRRCGHAEPRPEEQTSNQ